MTEMPPTPYGLVERLSPLVGRVLAPNPSAFTYTGTQTYLIGREELAVIDPGPAEDEHLSALIKAIAGRPVKAIMCTHTHRDHSPAAAPLASLTGAPIIGCAPLVIQDDGPRADASFDEGYAPDAVLGHGDSLSGADWTLQVLATPGHTSNHLCFDLVEEQALFTGDHVMGWSTSVISPPDGDMTAYMKSLALLMERTDRLYYPAHGAAVENPQRLVRGMLGHRKQREGQIIRHLERGVTHIPDMVATMYKGVDPRLHPAAGRSVLAHLIDLQSQGRVRQHGDHWRLHA